MSTAPDEHPQVSQESQQGSGERRRPARRAPRAQGSPVDEDARRERLEHFHAQLSEQVLSLTSSTAWTDWLQTAARFHHYSFRNTVAIWSQRPDATQVAGYQVWQGMGRQVRKGERGIEILAPVTRRVDDDDTDPGTPAGSLGGPGRPGRGGKEPGSAATAPRKVVGYRIAHVFDISQTDPLPGAATVTPPHPPQLLTGSAPAGLWDGLVRQVHEEGYTLVERRLNDPEVRGLTQFDKLRVWVVPDLEPAQRVKTLAHELGHVNLHAPRGQRATSPIAQGRREVEAESVAFLVTVSHGMDPSSYSFPYVAGWATETPDVEATLRDTGTRVLGAAHRILDRLDRDNPAPPVAEDAVPFELPSPNRATSVPAPPADRDRRPIPSPGAPGVAPAQRGVSR